MHLDVQKLTKQGGKLRQLRAIFDIPELGVKAGDFGGWYDDTSFICLFTSCWLSKGAFALEYSHICGNVFVDENVTLLGAKLSGNVIVNANATVLNCTLSDNTVVPENAFIEDIEHN